MVVVRQLWAVVGCGLMVMGCGFDDCGFESNLVRARWWVIGLGLSGSRAW